MVDAGMERDHAAAVAEAGRDAAEGAAAAAVMDRDALATKAGLAALEIRLTERMARPGRAPGCNMARVLAAFLGRTAARRTSS